MPLCVQNYVLGLIGVRFTRYLLLSVLVQSAYAAAFVTFGQSLVHTSAWRLALAISALLAVAMSAALVRRWLVRRPAACPAGRVVSKDA